MTGAAKLQRSCGCGGTCGRCAGDNGRVPPAVHDVLRSPGLPLDAATRAEMEPRFGRNFSDVRVHSGDREAASAHSVGALAYAAGRHIVLGETHVPRHVLAHELAHVAQDGGGDALPQRIGAASSSHEAEATRAETGGPITGARPAGGQLHRYRSTKAFNFGVADGGSLKEAAFTDKKKQPWIEKIDVHFTKTAKDSSGETIPTGTLTGTYFSNPAAMTAITASITGGTPSLGLTDKGTGFKIGRIEGIGYNDMPLGSAGEGPGTHYAKPVKGVFSASMQFALFFKGKEAIHLGSLTDGSHACVHTPDPPMQRLNYHSVSDKTTVDVSYDTAALTQPCCERGAAVGAKKKGDIPNPCNNIDPASCGGAKGSAKP